MSLRNRKIYLCICLICLSLLLINCKDNNVVSFDFKNKVMYTNQEKVDFELDLIGISIDEISFTTTNNDIITLDGQTAICTKPGHAVIEASYKDITVTMDLYVLPVIADVNMKVNETKTFDDNYFYESSSDLIKIEGCEITAISSSKERAIITAISKLDENIKCDFNIIVISEDIVVNINEFTFVNEEISFLTNYSLSDLVIDFNSEYIDIIENKIDAKKDGITNIIFSLKDDKNIKTEIELIIYSELPNIVIKDSNILAGDFSEVYLSNYNNDDFYWITDEDKIIIYDDYFFDALEPGSTTIKVINKENSRLTNEITINILYKPVDYRLSSNCLKVGDKLTLNLVNYKNYLDFDIEYDEEFFDFSDGVFTTKKVGETFINYSLKENKDIFFKAPIIIYDNNPIIKIRNQIVNEIEITLNTTIRIDVINYDEINDLVFEYDSKGNMNGYLFEALEVGSCEVKVYAKDHIDEYTIININILPIMPKLVLTTSNILVNDQTFITISNLEELEYKDISAYTFSADNEFAFINDDLLITGLKSGSVEIKAVAINNPLICSSIILNVYDDISYGEDLEPNKGPLIVSISDKRGYIEAGYITNIVINGAKNYEKYLWVSNNSLVATVNEKGRVIAINAGCAVITVYSKENKDIIGNINITVYGIPNVDYPDRLVSIAAEEIGYVEGAGNDTKYGAWYQLNYEAWCAMFVSWCSYQAGISTDIIPKYCGCLAGSEWFKARDLFKYKEDYIPKKGDIIFFLSNGASHTGIVTGCDGTTVYTIEGNTSSMVARRSYNIMHDTITGYGTPDYPEYIKK